MIGVVTLQGRLLGLPGRVTLSAGVTFCHVNVSRWVTRLGEVQFMLYSQQPLEASPQDPGVVSLHVNAGYFWTTARRVASPSWGPPPQCKQDLRADDKITQKFRVLKPVYDIKFVTGGII